MDRDDGEYGLYLNSPVGDATCCCDGRCIGETNTDGCCGVGVIDETTGEARLARDGGLDISRSGTGGKSHSLVDEKYGVDGTNGGVVSGVW